jgi:hypothetical protein
MANLCTGLTKPGEVGDFFALVSMDLKRLTGQLKLRFLTEIGCFH